MMMTASALLLGLVRGMTHALEPDHLAAVSTLVAESRGRSKAGLLLGAAWGAGHTLTLVVVGSVLMVSRAAMPPRVEAGLEFAVAVMLMGLGLRAIWAAVREGARGDAREHAHGEVHHTHAGVADHVHVLAWPVARRPLLIGIMHGLAGSGALTAAVMAELPSMATALAYMVLFGLGSAVGMALLSGVMGIPMARVVQTRRFVPLLMGASGTLSFVLGTAWAVDHATFLFG